MILDNINQETKSAKETKNPKKLFHFEIFTKNSNIPFPQELMTARLPINKSNNLNIYEPNFTSDQSNIGDNCKIDAVENRINNGKNEDSIHANKKIINKAYLMPFPIKSRDENLLSKNLWTRNSRCRNPQQKENDKSSSPGIFLGIIIYN